MSKTRPWVGVDFDGVLAHYDGWKGWQHTGEPIPGIVKRVKALLVSGTPVKIFTARVAENTEAVEVIRNWAQTQFGVALEVTNVKDDGMLELWDDRAVAIERNTGRVLSNNSRFYDLNAESEIARLRVLCAEAEPLVSVVCPTLGERIRAALNHEPATSVDCPHGQ